MFASFVDTLNQGGMMALFSVATLIIFARRFAASNPETAQRAGRLAAKGGMGLAKRLLK